MGFSINLSFAPCVQALSQHLADVCVHEYLEDAVSDFRVKGGAQTGVGDGGPAHAGHKGQAASTFGLCVELRHTLVHHVTPFSIFLI